MNFISVVVGFLFVSEAITMGPWPASATVQPC